MLGFGVSGSSCGVDLVFCSFYSWLVLCFGLPFDAGFGFGLVLFRAWVLGCFDLFVIAGRCCLWFVWWWVCFVCLDFDLIDLCFSFAVMDVAGFALGGLGWWVLSLWVGVVCCVLTRVACDGWL